MNGDNKPLKGINYKTTDKSEPCKAYEFMKKQNEGKPPWLRTNAIMYSCNCRRCNPYF